jgi:hypothetical protein
MEIPEERLEPENPASVLDTDPADIRSVAPLPVTAVVDGIQSVRVVTYRDHRPVHLIYVAAAAIGEESCVHGIKEELSLLVSAADEEWARSLPGSVPVVVLDETSPFSLAAAGILAVGGARDRLERAVVADLLERNVGTIAVDGSLLGRPATDSLIGVVKTTRTRYLADESVLIGLPEGWRSPRFILPTGQASCYVRLRSAENRGWDYGLIRLESSNPDLLDAAAAFCLAERQGLGNTDRRGDRHLASVAAVELFLKGRKPPVFNW